MVYIIGASTPLSFNFYLPNDVARLFPLHEKDWSDQPKYNDVAIVIEGTYEGTSSGSFAVNPILKSAASTSPNETTQSNVKSSAVSVLLVFLNNINCSYIQCYITCKMLFHTIEF